MRTPSEPPQDSRQASRQRLRVTTLVALLVVVLLAWPAIQSGSPYLSPPSDFQARGEQSTEPAAPPEETSIPATDTSVPPTATSTSSWTETPAPTSTSEATQAQGIGSSEADSVGRELIILSLDEVGYAHLFAYHPQQQPLLRLTDGPWSDIDPALSPDGQRLAFSSNRTGRWELFVMDLADGQITQVTDTPDFEAAPSWSPDGLWLAHEAYVEENLEIIVRPVAGDQPAIRLTNHSAADHSPSWSPRGRAIAFISTRTGEAEVWLADLDQGGEDRFRNLSQDPESNQKRPAWSPSGDQLAWVSVRQGIHDLQAWSADGSDAPPRRLGSGDWPAWSPDGTAILTRLPASNRSFLTAYFLASPDTVLLPPLALPGALDGLAWGRAQLPDPLPDRLAEAGRLTPTPAWFPVLEPEEGVPAGRRQIVTVHDLEGPYPQLHDLVDESFLAMRQRLAKEVGWDLLSSVENAFVPLTSPLAPGQAQDWLYTGRAIAFHTLPINAGWMVVVREDLGAQTYWRVYLRTRFQDGAQGRPLRELPWDLNARNLGDPRAYEEGGRLAASVPAGYWYDLTRLAAAFGWERQPAVPNWRTFYPGARFNELALTSGLDWRTAMLELYPPEVLITPTPIVPPTRTLTPTPRWYQTPTPTTTPTPRPTFTPAWTPVATHTGS